MLTVICPECAGENVKSIEKWEVSKLKVIAPPEPIWVCKDPRFMHKWASNRNPSMETTRSSVTRVVDEDLG
jgi:hypothetical protein